ncbi:chemotaxis signal transduction protein [Thermovibrio guaymasensis]|uniref:Chemotaxis signal transduction protein n=1 Tax=Thermovibrio guaymasensis TaxID=240167 RepID=A0A420W961_9BACT|nr:chemotaxis protein CheW [Thermovibrio guaymasensis]RKQ63873.1 chemotaxis signal transduction protein [Thermovibrio guaymasensis]
MDGKVNLLVFRVGEIYFSINTELIKEIVEVNEENIFPALSFPDTALGFLKHKNKAFVLVCLAKFLDIHSCTDVNGKDAVIVNISGRSWAVLADEIEGIFEVERSEYTTGEVNICQVEGKVVEELTAEFFLKEVNVPGIFEEEDQEEENFDLRSLEEKERILILETNGNLVGIQAEKVLKIEYSDNVQSKTFIDKDQLFEKAYVVGNKIVKATALSKFVGTGISTVRENPILIILKKDDKIIGFEVDEIIDFLELDQTSHFEDRKSDSKFKYFVNYKGKVVPVLSDLFIDNFLQKEGLKDEVSQEEFFREDPENEISFLVISIGEKEFLVEIESIVKIYKLDDVNLSPYPTRVEAIEGIVTTKNTSYFLVTLEKVLGTKIEDSEENRILIFRTIEGNEIALKISEVTNILSVPKRFYYKVTESKNYLVKGVVTGEENKLYEVLNPEAVFAKKEKEELPK